MYALCFNDASDAISDVSDNRVAARSRMLMRAKLRVRGLTGEHAISIKDISSTGLKASGVLKFLSGTRVEIDLRNIGWVAGQIIWTDADGCVGIRFSSIINAECTRTQISGSYALDPPRDGSAIRRL